MHPGNERQEHLEVAIFRFLRLVVLVTKRDRIRTEHIRRQICNFGRKMMTINITGYTMYKQWKTTEYLNISFTKD